MNKPKLSGILGMLLGTLLLGTALLFGASAASGTYYLIVRPKLSRPDQQPEIAIAMGLLFAATLAFVGAKLVAQGVSLMRNTRRAHIEGNDC